MTFIASLKVKNGIIQISDSLELQTGAISRFDDFKKLIDTKGIDEENEEVKLTAKEVWNTFKPERIKNIDGAQKTFKVSDFASVQTAGTVDINGTEVKEIVKQLSNQIADRPNLTHQEIVDEFMTILKPNFPDKEFTEFENPDLRETFPNTTFICSIFEPNTGEKYVHTLSYGKNIILKKYHFSDRYEGVENNIYFSAGMVGLSHNFHSLNHNILKKPLTFRQGFQVLKSALDLAILTETVNYDVLGVGGTINYSMIDKDGFRFIQDETSLTFE